MPFCVVAEINWDLSVEVSEPSLRGRLTNLHFKQKLITLFPKKVNAFVFNFESPIDKNITLCYTDYYAIKYNIS